VAVTRTELIRVPFKTHAPLAAGDTLNRSSFFHGTPDGAEKPVAAELPVAEPECTGPHYPAPGGPPGGHKVHRQKSPHFLNGLRDLGAGSCRALCSLGIENSRGVSRLPIEESALQKSTELALFVQIRSLPCRRRRSTSVHNSALFCPTTHENYEANPKIGVSRRQNHQPPTTSHGARSAPGC